MAFGLVQNFNHVQLVGKTGHTIAHEEVAKATSSSVLGSETACGVIPAQVADAPWSTGTSSTKYKGSCLRRNDEGKST